MTHSIEETRREVAEGARAYARESSERLFKSYLENRDPHLKYLEINDFDKLSQKEIIQKLSDIKCAEKRKNNHYNFDRLRYKTASTALIVEEERGRSAIDITVNDLSKFIKGFINAAG